MCCTCGVKERLVNKRYADGKVFDTYKRKKPRKMLKGPGFIDEKKREEWTLGGAMK